MKNIAVLLLFASFLGACNTKTQQNAAKEKQKTDSIVAHLASEKARYIADSIAKQANDIPKINTIPCPPYKANKNL